jgi:microsomal dipeptidase-like Zn-dependent dipeptidase
VIVDALVDQVDDDAGTKERTGLEGFTGPDDFPALVAALQRRGYDGARLDAILSTNWLRILAVDLTSDV